MERAEFLAATDRGLRLLRTLARAFLQYGHERVDVLVPRVDAFEARVDDVDRRAVRPV